MKPEEGTQIFKRRKKKERGWTLQFQVENYDIGCDFYLGTVCRCPEYSWSHSKRSFSSVATEKANTHKHTQSLHQVAEKRAYSYYFDPTLMPRQQAEGPEKGERAFPFEAR